jgi:small GTP-binding protein
MDYLKVVITGPFNAGKTSFIRTVSELRGVNTDVRTDSGRHVKGQTTVAMDFGRVTLRDGTTLHLIGTPGQNRFAFLWEMLIIECNGILLLVDSQDQQSLADAGKMVDFFRARANGVPIFVIANKQDLAGALPPQEVAHRLNLVGPDQAGRTVAMLPPPGCIAEDPTSVMSILETIAPHLAAGTYRIRQE